MNVEIHPAAAQELLEHAKFYAAAAPSLAAEFLGSIESAIHRIQAFPLAGPENTHGVRKAAVRRFPFVIHYEVHPGKIWIVALAHQRRNPGYWHGCQ